MRSFIIAVVLVAMLATFVSADDDLRNCNSLCAGVTDNTPICGTYLESGFRAYKVYPNSCYLKIENCKYPGYGKFIGIKAI